MSSQAFSAAHDGVRLSAWDFDSQHDVRLRLYVAKADDDRKPQALVLHVLDESGWDDAMAACA